MKRIVLSSLLLAGVYSAQGQQIVRGEYWVDTDGGIGQCTPIMDLPAAGDLEHTFQIPVTSLAPGMHIIGLRTMDENARWSHTSHMPVLVADSSHGTITRVEYFWDTDPGFGQSALDSTLSAPASDWPGVLNATVPIDLGLGSHQLMVRTLDDRGRWSHTNIPVPINVDGTTDVAALAAFGISVFPDPFVDQVTVRTTDGQGMRVVIYDPQGRLVHDRMFNGESTIDLAGRASGTYTAFFWKERELIHRTVLIKR